MTNMSIGSEHTVASTIGLRQIAAKKVYPEVDVEVGDKQRTCIIAGRAVIGRALECYV